MGNYFFYGTLRSIPVLEKVIGMKSNHLDIIPAFAPKSELRLVIDENFPVIIFGLDVESIMDDNKWWILPAFCYHLIGNPLLRIWFTRQFAKGKKFPEWMRRDAGHNLLIYLGVNPTKKNTVVLAITLIVSSLILLLFVMND